MLAAALEAGYADRARAMLARAGDDLPMTRALLDRLREAVGRARRAGPLIELAWAEETLAIALILQGDPAAALEVLEATFRGPESSGSTSSDSCWPRGRAP